jgi:hypothetical protein
MSDVVARGGPAHADRLADVTRTDDAGTRVSNPR